MLDKQPERHARRSVATSSARRPAHPDRRPGQHPGRRRPRRPPDHRHRPAVVRPERRSPKVKETRALSGTVVVMEVETGKLLAVASYPTFDPNDLGQGQAGNLGNRAFDDVFEPGSTGKVMTMAAALEEGVVTPRRRCHRARRLHAGRHVVPGLEPHGDRAPDLRRRARQVQQHRHHPGRREARRRRPCTATCRKFGIGSKPPVGFPGESPGLLAASRRTGAARSATRCCSARATRVNAVQAAGVFQTIANDGRPRAAPPRRRHRQRRRHHCTRGAPATARRVVSADTAAKQLREMLEDVVGKDGTAPRGPDPGLPRRRQDRHRRPLRRQARPLQRLHGLVHRLRPGRRPRATSSRVIIQRAESRLLRRRRRRRRCSTTS